MADEIRCLAPSCGKPSNLQCPTCRQLGLPPSNFCSQECFKSCWASHKKLHVQPVDQKAIDLAALLAAYGQNTTTTSDTRFVGFKFTGKMRPYPVSPMRSVPVEIPRPEYYLTGVPVSERTQKASSVIPVNTPEQIERIRTVCRMGREILDMAGRMVAVGVTTEDIDAAVHKATIERGAYPSPLNYGRFPKACCTSVNEIICHGIPDARPLQDGDIVNIDISVFYGGMHADLNQTFCVGNVDAAGKKLINTTREALQLAIEACKPGFLYRDLGAIITRHCSNNGFSVVRSYCGHGVGELFHCLPNVPHYSKNKAKGVMKPGHVFTIEPMINEGTWEDVTWPDDWTSATKDGKRSAQFEHQILITEDGYELLTGPMQANVE